MKQSARIATVCFIFGLCGSALSFAAESMRTTATPSGVPAYVSGGIGADDPILNTKQDYNLHLVFAAQGNGEYLADVRVAIQKANGENVLEADSPGPMFFAKLPPGKYRITASYAGKAQSKSTDVRATGARDIHFYWN